MEALLTSLVDLFIALWGVFVSLFHVLLPWLPLAAWVGFWMFAVDWQKFQKVLRQGGWIAVLFIGLMMVLIWGLIAPPADGFHYLLGLKTSNFIGKFAYVAGLFGIMFLCGAVQPHLTDCCGRVWEIEDESPAAGAAHGHH